VGKTITVAIIAATLALAAPLTARAAGLGKLTVLSPLGQPLNAEIDIVALRPGEEETLTARVAPPEAFSAAGIEPTAALSGMRFAIERRDGGRRVLRLTTMQPVNEPFVELLVELQWASGRLVREYTFLLDPPEYKGREAIAAAPPLPPITKPLPAPAEAPTPVPPLAAVEEKPAPAVEKTAPAAEAKPIEPPAPVAPPPPPVAAAEPPKQEEAVAEKKEERVAQRQAEEPAKEEGAKPEASEDEFKVHEVQKGDTLGKVARDHLPPGITLNQMLVAIYRANEKAFIRGNVNLVREGRILNIPSTEAIGTVDAEEANRIVRAHMAEFRDYRSRLAAIPATADAAPGQRDAAGPIEPKAAAPKPAAAEDQVRLSKVDPQKSSASAGRAAREDDAVARERALKEAQSRISDLEKNVADLQKLLELKNQQLAELEKKAAGAKPAPAAKAPEKPAAEPAAPAPVAKAPETPKPPAAAAKPVSKAAPPPPEPSLLDELLENQAALGGLGLIVLLLVGYSAYAWRKKKTTQARFQDSVAGAAAAGAGVGEPTLGSSSASASQPAASAPPGMAGGEEVDPIAEADVYMAYGRDAQAEEILKEALQKDSNRPAVHAKLLEIYAKRRDTTAFEQTALRLKNLTNGSGPEWEKAAALGKSIDPDNALYAAAVVPAAVAAAAAPAPALDFDIGGAQPSGSVPDLALDAGPKAADTGIDFDVSGASEKKDFAEEAAPAPKAAQHDAGLDFNLDLQAPSAPQPENEPARASAAADPGLTFDLNLDMGEEKKPAPAAAPPAPDLSTISLDLGSSESAAAPAAGTDPKWQEIATKLDLAKAYEEMGDRDGARELLNEVMKDGDAAQKGQAQQLLAKLA